VFAVSIDRPEAARKLRQDLNLTFLILSDPRMEVTRAYQMKGEGMEMSDIGKLLSFIVGVAILITSGPAGAADPLAAMRVVLTERGKEVPDFTLPDPEGNHVGLRDFRGKVVLLTFFTTW
jgi:peroxiredoxin